MSQMRPLLRCSVEGQGKYLPMQMHIGDREPLQLLQQLIGKVPIGRSALYFPNGVNSSGQGSSGLAFEFGASSIITRPGQRFDVGLKQALVGRILAFPIIEGQQGETISRQSKILQENAWMVIRDEAKRAIEGIVQQVGTLTLDKGRELFGLNIMPLVVALNSRFDREPLIGKVTRRVMRDRDNVYVAMPEDGVLVGDQRKMVEVGLITITGKNPEKIFDTDLSALLCSPLPSNLKPSQYMYN